MSVLNFDATKVEPAGLSQQLPVSDSNGHLVMIAESEMKENKNKDGGYLELMLTILDGPHKGESGAYRLNLFHNNPKTVEIAYRQLSAVCHAVGLLQVADSTQLHNLPFRAVVGLQKGDNPEGYTEVKGVLTKDGLAPGKTAAPTPPAQPAAAAGFGQPPVPPQQPSAPPTGFSQPAPDPAAQSTAAAPPWQQQGGQTAAAPPWGAPK